MVINDYLSIPVIRLTSTPLCFKFTLNKSYYHLFHLKGRNSFRCFLSCMFSIPYRNWEISDHLGIRDCMLNVPVGPVIRI